MDAAQVTLRTKSKKPVLEGMLYVAFKTLAGCVKDDLAKRDARIEALERRFEELVREKCVEMRYVGIWRAGWHSPGDLVTHEGTLWYCHDRTEERPGTTEDWQLMVKRISRPARP